MREKKGMHPEDLLFVKRTTGLGRTVPVHGGIAEGESISSEDAPVVVVGEADAGRKANARLVVDEDGDQEIVA